MAEEYEIDRSLGYAISIVYGLMRADIEGRFRACGYDITAPQWILLNRLWEHDGISQQELARVTRKDKTNVARMVRRLGQKGLIERHRGQNDERVQCIHLTPAGEQMEHELKAVAAETLRHALRGIPQDAVDATREILWQAIENLAPGEG